MAEIRRGMVESLFSYYLQMDAYERAFLRKLRNFTLSKLFRMTYKQVKYLTLLDMKYGRAFE